MIDLSNKNPKSGGGIIGRAREMFSSRAATLALAAGAILMLAGGTVNGARAALTYYSEDYVARVSMDNVGVSIVENGERVSWRDYSEKSDGSWDEHIGTMAFALSEGEGGYVKIGKAYGENLAVRNSGGIESYVRVVVNKYWEDQDGKRRQDLEPDFIRLDGLGGDGWIVDETASTDERMVLYYTKPLAIGQETTPFLESIMADPVLADLAVETETKDGKYTYIETTFPYDGMKIGIEVEADSVQTHNIEQAAWSAWGRKVGVANGSLYLEGGDTP